jgi:hypothetical protein
VQRRDVDELESNREVGELPRRARDRVDPSRASEQRGGTGVEAPEPVLRGHARHAELDA